MESQGRTWPSANSLGFCLLPSELIHTILLNLALPEVQRLRSVNRALSGIVSDHSFIYEFNSRSKSYSWLFFCKKRWSQDATLQGFTDRTRQWFTIPIARLLKPAIFPGEDVYFLTANGNIFLFASNTQRGLIAADVVSKRVKKIPPGPLGPRGTSSWRRSGMKLMVDGSPGSTHFRFLFVESVENRPTLFTYSSETDEWRSTEAEENDGTEFRDNGDYVFLNLMNGPRENIVIAVERLTLRPIILRPRFTGAGTNARGHMNPTVGFNWGNLVNRLHVFGDGHMMIVRSTDDITDHNLDRGTRMLGSIEVWGLSAGGECWEVLSKAPETLMANLRRPYGVLMGCLEVRDGITRAALVSNFEGLWDIIWLSYDKLNGSWNHISVPDCRMKGSNMAGIAFSTGLTLSLSSTL